MPVIEERMMEKKIRNRVAFAPDYAKAYMRFSVIERTETRIIMKETHVQRDAPYVKGFDVWVKWEILTPDPRSRQVVIRK